MEMLALELKQNKYYKVIKHFVLTTLMVTIIILLILAGVTIAELTGNGLFIKAQIAREREKEAEGVEQNRLSDYEKQISSTRDVGDKNPVGTVSDMASQGVTGVFTKSNGSWRVATGNGGAGFGTLGFDASRSSDLYGKSTHVTPTNTSVLYCIKAK